VCRRCIGFVAAAETLVAQMSAASRGIRFDFGPVIEHGSHMQSKTEAMNSA
jgi:hypothetical protein